MSLSTSGQISFSQINSALRITNGNLGIGTTAPSQKLDISGTVKGNNYTGGSISLSGELNATGVNITGGIAVTGSLTNGGFDFVLGNTDQSSRGNSGQSRALVKDVGNTLVVNYGGDYTGGTEINSVLKVTNNFINQQGDTFAQYVLTNSSGRVELGLNPSNQNNNASYLWDFRAKDMTIGTNNIERLRIKADGNIGIGTALPGERLDVRGNLRVGNSTQSNYIVFSGVQGDGQGSWNHTYIGERLFNGNDFSELLLFKGNDPATTSGPDRIRLLAPEIDFDTYDAFVAGTFDGVATYGTTQMTITTSGSICMGTTRTSAKLNMGGSIDMDNSPYIVGYGEGPLTIDPNYTSNNYIQLYDEVRIGNSILKGTSATMGGSLLARDWFTITADNQPVLRLNRNGGAGWWDGEILMPATGAVAFRGGADGTGASLTEFLRIGGNIVSMGSVMIPNAFTAASMVVTSSVDRTLSYGYFNSLNVIATGSGSVPVSVYASARLATTELNAYSDERIKKNIVDINDTSALETIRQIQPKRYNYIDTVSKGETPVWGFIAQQVASVLDYSVKKMHDYVPNIYNKASVVNDTDGSILTLESGTTSVLDIAKAPEDKIQIRIHIDSEKECMKEVYVKEILNTNQIKLEENLDASITEVFVYGQKVNDFHSLNKNAIFTVSVAALQEVDRQLQDAIQLDIAHQETIDTLTQQIQDILTRMEAANL